jgi:hypothetical protein
MTPAPTGPTSAGGSAAERTTWASGWHAPTTDECPGPRASGWHAPTTDECPGPRNWTPARAETPRTQLTHHPDTEGSQDLTL